MKCVYIYIYKYNSLLTAVNSNLIVTAHSHMKGKLIFNNKYIYTSVCVWHVCIIVYFI